MAEIIATRETLDGVQACFWADGVITCGSARAKVQPIIARNIPRSMLWLLANEVCLYEASELKALVRAARKAWDANARNPHRVLASDRLRLTRAFAAMLLKTG